MLLQGVESGIQSDEYGELSCRIFTHICMVMSLAPDEMLEPFFILLLDILDVLVKEVMDGAALSQQAATCHVKSMLRKVISLIPSDTYRDTLGRQID